MQPTQPPTFSFNNMASWNQQSFRRYAQKLEPLLKKPQNRVYTATILSFLVVSLFLWYAIRPTMQTIFTLRREIADNTEVSKQMEEKISALVLAQAAYQRSADKLNLLNQALPKEPEPVSVLFAIRELAKESNATISALLLPRTDLVEQTATISGTRVQSATPEFFALTVTVDGTYEQISQFLNGLTKLRRIATIQQITISTPDTIQRSLDQPILRLITQIHAHYHSGGQL